MRASSRLSRKLSTCSSASTTYTDLAAPRLLNQCFFIQLIIDGGDVVGAVLREPWATLLAEDFRARMIHNTTNPDRDFPGQGSSMKTLVRLAGLEPATGCLEGSCSIQLSYRRPGLIVHDRGRRLGIVLAKSSAATGRAVGRPARGTGPCLSS